MIFLKVSMLLGLVAVVIPILIHLLSRRRRQAVPWGAMQFLFGSVTKRNRRILLEEFLLLTLRCLFMILLALALANPVLTGEHRTAWLWAFPALLAVALFLAAASVLKTPRGRWLSLAAAVILLGVAGSVFRFDLDRIGLASAVGEKTDMAIIIDASPSMALDVDGRSNFERTIEEVRGFIQALRGGDAAGLILAGASPQIITPVPDTRRDTLLAALPGLRLQSGSMRPLESLKAASVLLGKGEHPNKKVVFFTDGQALGWELDNPVHWALVRDLFNALDPAVADEKNAPPRPVPMLFRQLPPARPYRNLAFADLRFSRRVIGPDRPVSIEVDVENTGDADAGPARILLETGDPPRILESAVKRLPPGDTETVRFEHRFEAAPGASPLRPITLRLELEDDLAADNREVRVIRVSHTFRVLIIDGNPSRRPLERASGFLEAALHVSVDTNAPPLFQIDVLEAPRVAELAGLYPYQAVILANVPQLPSEFARQLLSFIKQGGGLLVGLGERSRPSFYNEWKDELDRLVLGSRLRERRVAQPEDEPVRPDPTTFGHPALMPLADAGLTDLGDAEIRAWWQLEPTGGVAGSDRLTSGDPFLASRKLGHGRVLTTAVSFDLASGSLPTRRAFVPLVHELLYELVSRDRDEEVNLRPGLVPTLRLNPRLAEDGSAGSGLRGDYFEGRQFDKLRLTRIDGPLQFDWSHGSPAALLPRDNFSVRWTGMLVPKAGGNYTLHLNADDRAQLWLDGNRILHPPHQRTAKVEMESGATYDLVVEYEEGAHTAHVHLEWEPPGGARETVPAAQLVARRPMETLVRSVEGLPLSTPGGEIFVSHFKVGDAALDILPGRALSTGLYGLQLPPSLRPEFPHLVGSDGTVPFAVGGALDEGRMRGLTDDDFRSLADYVSWQRPETVEQLAAVVRGEGAAGKPYWRFLLLAAIVVMVLETALARWIAVGRETGTTETVDFVGAAEEWAVPSGWESTTHRLSQQSVKPAKKSFAKTSEEAKI